MNSNLCRPNVRFWRNRFSVGQMADRPLPAHGDSTVVRGPLLTMRQQRPKARVTTKLPLIALSSAVTSLRRQRDGCSDPGKVPMCLPLME
jgi:hypothetical protein